MKLRVLVPLVSLLLSAQAALAAPPRGWVRLIRGDDWGAQFYRHPKVKTPYDTYGIAGEGVIFPPTIRVRWPSGEVTRERLTTVPFMDQVGDMGHVYTVSSSLPAIETTVHGSKTAVFLDQVDLAEEDVFVNRTLAKHARALAEDAKLVRAFSKGQVDKRELRARIATALPQALEQQQRDQLARQYQSQVEEALRERASKP
jgi:hypothetical protein